MAKDYRINQAWADANLVGKGWSGSDIAPWSYYTADADTVSNVLFNGLQPVFAADITTAVPEYSMDVLFNGLQPVFAADITTAVPEYSMDVLFNGLQPVFAGDMTIATPSENVSNVLFNGLQPVFAANVINAGITKPLPFGRYNSTSVIEPPYPVDSTPEQANQQQRGELVKINWKDIHPSQGVTDFSSIQFMLDEAVFYNKYITLIVTDSKSAPQWVKDSAGADLLTYSLTNNGNTTIETTPLAWNANYLAHKKELVDALGVAFDNHSRLRGVYFTYAAMGNGAEFHFRLKTSEKNDYDNLGYTFALQTGAARQVLDMYRWAFPTTTIFAEGHTVFSDNAAHYQNLYDYAYSIMGTRFGIGAWWCATKIALNTSGIESDAPMWPLIQAAIAQGTPTAFQHVGNFTSTPDRFDHFDGEGLTSAQHWVREYKFFTDAGGNYFEVWEQDIKDNGGTLIEYMLYNSDISFNGLQPTFSADITNTGDSSNTSDVLFNGLQPVFAADITTAVPEYSMDVLFNGLQPVFAADITTAVPEYSMDVLFNGLQPVFAADITTAVPEYSMDVLFNGLQPVFAADITTAVPEYSMDVLFNGLQPVFAGDMTIATPGENVSNVLFNGLQPVFAADITTAVPEYSMDVLFNGLQPVFNADITTAVPEYSMDVLFNGLQPVFAASVDVDIPGAIISNVLFNGLQPVFNASVDVDIPYKTMDISFNGLQPVFSCIINTGQLNFVLIDSNNINVPYFSGNIDIPFQSTNINL